MTARLHLLPAFLAARVPGLFVAALAVLAAASGLGAPGNEPTFSRGDVVRLVRGEMLAFNGKNIASGARDQEFAVLKQDGIRKVLFVEYYKDDGTLVAVSAPATSFEAAPADGWRDVLKGLEAFQELRTEDARRLLTRAAQDAEQKTLASSLSAKISAAVTSSTAARAVPGARPAFAANLQALRDLADQLAKSGQLSLAMTLDQGIDRLAASVPGATVPPTKLDRTELAGRVATAARDAGRARQIVGQRKLFEAQKVIAEGLQAEPERADLKTLQARVQKDIREADDHHKNALGMRQRFKGTVHALTAVEMGLKLCVDHPSLRALKKDMQSAFEERTSPPVSPTLVSLAGSGASRQTLDQGYKLYTTLCSECHDLELLDSRSITAWRDVVARMSGRAKIGSAQQETIIAYLTAAQRSLDSGGQ